MRVHNYWNVICKTPLDRGRTLHKAGEVQGPQLWHSHLGTQAYLGSFACEQLSCVSFSAWIFHMLFVPAEPSLNQTTYMPCSVAKSCPSLCDPMDSNPPDSFVRGAFQTRILKWVAIFFSRGSSQMRYWTHASRIGRWILYHWAT